MERHFYERQHLEVSSIVSSMIEKRAEQRRQERNQSVREVVREATIARLAMEDTDISNSQEAIVQQQTIKVPNDSQYDALTDKELTKLSTPLLRLRQACCHPQVGFLSF